MSELIAKIATVINEHEQQRSLLIHEMITKEITQIEEKRVEANKRNDNEESVSYFEGVLAGLKHALILLSKKT